jgi:hypothetical protein
MIQKRSLVWRNNLFASYNTSSYYHKCLCISLWVRLIEICFKEKYIFFEKNYFIILIVFVIDFLENHFVKKNHFPK